MRATAVLLLYAAAANAILAANIGTCTMGSADEMLMVVISLPLTAIGAFLLGRQPSNLITSLLMAPLWAILIWQAYFVMTMLLALGAQGMTICQFLQGIPHPPDGREMQFLTIWSLSASVCPLLLIWSMKRRRTV